MRWIYISPHLDDVVLSCGGLIWEQSEAGVPVEIWTIAAGFPPAGEFTPFAQLLHAQWGVAGGREAVRMRREEDRRAAKHLGAKPVHLNVADAIYRRGPRGEILYADIFVSPHPAEAWLPAKIAATLVERLKRDDTLVGPLAIGGHVDHIIVRSAVEQCGRLSWYYADVPYVLDRPEELNHAAAGLRPVSFPISEEGLAAWQDAIAAYASQVEMLFASKEQMQAAVRDYWAAQVGLTLRRIE